LSEDEAPGAGRPLAGRIELAAASALLAVRLIFFPGVHSWIGYLINALLAILLIAVLARARGRIKNADRLIVIGVGLYFLAALVSVPFSIMGWTSLRWLVLHAGHLLAFVLVIAVLARRRSWLVAALIAAGMATAIFALRQRFGGFERTLATPGLPEYAIRTLREGRVFGLTSSPDMLAGILAGLIPLSLSCIRVGRGFGRETINARLMRLLGLVSLATFIPALYYTRSVGGVLAAGAGIGIWLFLNFAPRASGGFGLKRIAAAIALAALVLAAGLWFIHSRGGKFFDLDNPHNPVMRRLDNWSTGLAAWREFPLTGAGGGQIGLASLLHKRPGGNEAKHSHNTLVEVLGETGPVGLAGLLLLLAGLARAGFRLHKRMRGPPGEGGGDRLLSAGFFAGGAAVFLHSTIDYDWAVIEVATIFWVSLAVMSSPGAGSGLETRREDRPSPIVTVSIIAALGFLILAELYVMEGARRRQAAMDFADLGDWTAAGEAAERCLAWDRTSDEMWAFHAQALARTGNTDGAVRALGEAIRLNPRYPFHHRDLGFILGGSDQAAACAQIAKAVLLYPNSMLLNLHHGRCLKNQGRFDEAERVLLHAAECHNINAQVLFELASLYKETGREELAKEYLDRARKAGGLPKN